MLTGVASLLAAAAATATSVPPITEPFPLLQGANPAGNPAVAASPDPLVAMTWEAATTNLSQMQSYVTNQPVRWVADPPSAFTGLESLGTDSSKVTVHAPGTLRLDFGVERAAWWVSEGSALAASCAAVRPRARAKGVGAACR